MRPTAIECIMKIKTIFYLLAFTLVFIADLFHSGNTVTATGLTARAYKRGELLVKYKAGTRTAASMRYQKNLGITTIKRFKADRGSVVKLPNTMGVDHALDILKTDPDVEWAEPNYLRHAFRTPDDAFFEDVWGLNSTGQAVNGTQGTDDADIDATDAWDTTTGDASIIIAVIDSGVDYNHPDLKDNIWTNGDEEPDNGIDDDNNGYIDDVHGWDFADNDNDPMDSNDHGTHVAGTIGARGDNATGISGVCWTVKLMPLKFLDSLGVGLVSDEVEAIQYAIDNGAHIINASFGDPTYSSPELEAIGEAQYAGLLFVTAAGNTGVDIDTNPVYPAAYSLDNIISVTASNQDDELPAWANYGDEGVDIAAPGENIYSTIPGKTTVWEEDFESDPSTDWTLQGDWTRTTSFSYDGDYSLSTGGKYYTNDSDRSAISPLLDFTDIKNILLSFYLVGASEAGDDLLFLETYDGNQWSRRPIEVIWDSGSQVFDEDDGISGSFRRWVYATVTLDHLEGIDGAKIRFRFITDATNNRYNGWYIDGLSISSMDGSFPNPQNQYYGFLDGTSSATPYVSGVAGLIWSRVPDLSAECVKWFIMEGVDPVSAFSTRTLSGGRLNAYTSLTTAVTQGASSSCNVSSGGDTDSDSGFCFIRTCH